MKELENFTTEILNSEKITVVKVFANWCGPCKMLVPVMDRLIETNPDVAFIQMNADNNKDFLKQMGIKSIPHVIVYKNGKEVGNVSGLKLQRDYQELIDNAKD